MTTIRLVARKWLVLCAIFTAMGVGFAVSAWLRLQSGTLRIKSADLELTHDYGVAITPAPSRTDGASADSPQQGCHTFVIPNPWPDREWHVKISRVSCGCQRPTLQSELVLPGGAAHVKMCPSSVSYPDVRYDYVLLETDHPRIRTVACVLRGFVVPEILLDVPNEKRFSIDQTPRYSFSMHYHSRSPDPPVPLTITTDQSDVQVKTSQVMSRRYRRDVWRHTVNGSLTLTDEGEEQLRRRGTYDFRIIAIADTARLDWMVTFSIPRPIQVRPQALYVTGPESVLEVTATERLVITEIRNPDDRLAWHTESAADGRSLTIYVQPKRQDVPSVSQAELHIHVERPEKTVVTVPVTIFGGQPSAAGRNEYDPLDSFKDK